MREATKISDREFFGLFAAPTAVLSGVFMVLIIVSALT